MFKASSGLKQVIVRCGICGPVFMNAALGNAAESRELSLNDLLNLKVSVATKKNTGIRETPGIVTVITREQMLDMGARDVVDVLLRMVPGYSLVSEIEGGQLLSIRGLNSIEGKFLVMIDGLDINEEKFGVVQFARHFPIATIERIEIIRGPGSSIYGGYASLGVINIMTRSYNNPGSYVSIEGEQGSRAFLSRTLAAGVAKDYGDLKYSTNVVVSKSLLTDQTVKTYYGETVDFRAASIDLASINFDIKYQGSYAKGLVDIYRVPEYYFDEPEKVQWQHVRERFDTYQVELGHAISASKNLTITPFVNYKLQYPYWVDQGLYWYRNRVERKTAGVTMQYELNDKTNFTGGYQGFTHTLYRAPNLNTGLGEEVLKSDPEIKSIGYRNDSIFLQAINNNDIANLTVGVRYDKTDLHGEFAAPRIGFTKIWNDLHAKYMVARSFRVPGGMIPNRIIDKQNYTIKPETTLNNEVEVGYRFSDDIWAAVNVFDHIIHKPIVYFTGLQIGSYANGGDIGTRGLETEIRFQSAQAHLTFTYSYYQLTKNDVDSAKVPDHDKAGYGLAQNKAGLVSGYKFTKTFSVNPSLSLIGDRFAYNQQGAVTGVDENGDDVRGPALLKKLPLTVLANVNIRQTELLGYKGLDGSLAVENVSNVKFDVAQPYEAEYPFAPIAFPGRSLMARMEYNF